MNTIQKLVTSGDRANFDQEVNRLLATGKWKVVPGTLVATATALPGSGSMSDHRQCWAVVLETKAM